MFRAAGVAAFALLIASGAHAQAVDPNQWLEEVETPRALDWVKAENDKTLPVLTGDKRYQSLHDEALKILSATDRIPTPQFEGEAVFNFWQDASHVRGVWRKTTRASFKTAKPQWETVIDLDALSKAENANWIWKGADCRGPRYDRCLVRLSNGGKDAVQVREFDMATKTFVAGGFNLPEGKQNVAWLDDDTLVLSRDWGAGSLTDSGYGMVVKTLKRGQALIDAKEIFRGVTKDVSANARVMKDGAGNKIVVLSRATDFFNTEYSLLTDAGAARMSLPTRSSIQGFVNGELIVTLEEAWTAPGGKAFQAGALIAATPAFLTGKGGEAPALLFQPNPRQSIDQVAVTKNRVVAATYDNVRGRMMAFEKHAGHGWMSKQLSAPENASVSLVAASDVDDAVFYSAESFLVPTELELADAATGAAETVKTSPARFDAAGLVVEQHEATSKDGTKVPYFLVRQKGLKFDGLAPTILHAYGGFQLSKLPVYDGVIGKLWLERGGAYVIANIRGGGEFGPAWHEAALKANRQRAFDDYYAVAEDLIARKVTTPRHLGIYGRSNGGLLMGVSLTQRPDLYNAVVVESPLLDMMRYHLLPAGASWIGEYGDPTKPEEAGWIAKYSAYQHLKPGTKYPLAYITTSTKDDRVHPGHARKFAARMKDLGAPYLYYENTDGGHANGADPKANAKRWAMHYVYLSRQLMD